MTKPCPFCLDQIQDRIIEQGGWVVTVLDGFPVTPGHTLIIPIVHVETFLDMSIDTRFDAMEMAAMVSQDLQADDPTITGFNIGMNCGVSAGQTIPHAHVHVIPRRDGDCENPRGGVRGVIPRKQSYA